MASRPWTRDETLVALNIYCRTPFGRLHARNPEVVRAAEALGRSPSSVAMKCCNIAAFDPALRARGVKGLSKVSRLDKEIWDEFAADPEEVGYESAIVLANKLGNEVERTETVEWEQIEGLDRTAVTKIRVNQALFRAIVLAGYQEQCCVCAMPIRSLLVASHIVPWSIDRALRMDPCNGLCLCVLHDRAFDRGLFGIRADYAIQVGEIVRRHSDNSVVASSLLRFEGERLRLPDRWHPNPVFFARHDACVCSPAL